MSVHQQFSWPVVHSASFGLWTIGLMVSSVGDHFSVGGPQWNSPTTFHLIHNTHYLEAL